MYHTSVWHFGFPSRLTQNEWAELASHFKLSGSAWIFDRSDQFKFYMRLPQELIEWNSCPFCYRNITSRVSLKALELQSQVVPGLALSQAVLTQSSAILRARLSPLPEGPRVSKADTSCHWVVMEMCCSLITVISAYAVTRVPDGFSR